MYIGAIISARCLPVKYSTAVIIHCTLYYSCSCIIIVVISTLHTIIKCIVLVYNNGTSGSNIIYVPIFCLRNEIMTHRTLERRMRNTHTHTHPHTHTHAHAHIRMHKYTSVSSVCIPTAAGAYNIILCSNRVLRFYSSFAPRRLR